MAEFNPQRARAKRPCPLWVDAFQRDTQHLEADEIGAYLLILMAMWTRESCDFPADDARLSRVARVSLRLWKSRVGPALRGFFSTENGMLFSKRLREEASYVERQVKHQSDRRSCDKTDKSLKNQDTTSTADISADTPRHHPSQQPNIKGGGGGARAHEPAHASARGDDQASDLANLPDDAVRLYEQVMAACGVPQFPLPRYWMPPMAIIEVVRWRGYGLADEEIVEVARGSRKSKTGPPDGPKALERFMATAASVKVNRRKPMQQITGDSQNDRDSSSDAGSEALRRSIARAATPDKGVAGW